MYFLAKGRVNASRRKETRRNPAICHSIPAPAAVHQPICRGQRQDAVIGIFLPPLEKREILCLDVVELVDAPYDVTDNTPYHDSIPLNILQKYNSRCKKRCTCSPKWSKGTTFILHKSHPPHKPPPSKPYTKELPEARKARQ